MHSSRFNSSLSSLRKANLQGIYDPHTNMMCYPKITQPTHARWEEVPPAESDVPSIVRRNYLVVDTYVQSPPFSGLGIPGPDGDFCDIGPNGLPNVSEEDLTQMDPKVRQAYLDAKQAEHDWKNQWQGEATDGSRANIKIGYTGVPV
jgi:chromatin structure-remodeling complex protein RSC7